MGLKKQVREARIFISFFLFVLQINLKDIGEISKIHIGHDNGGEDPGWYVEEVTLENMATRERFLLTVDSWISDRENDGQYTWKEVPIIRSHRGPLLGMLLHFFLSFLKTEIIGII